jgi:hypothetical protein
MHLDPQKSRQAHSEIRTNVCVAASPSQPLASSPAPGMRDNQPASCRGDDAGQPWPLVDETRRRHVRPIPAHVLQQIFNEDQAFNCRDEADDATWSQIGIAVLAAVALVLFLFFLDGGWIK